ncbi:MAG: metallophosphoesterase [Comamonas sp.]
MKIQLMSDLHLERYPDFAPQHAPGADVLVLAGDIGSYQGGSLLQDQRFGLERFSPKHGAPWKRVFFQPGNHEFDALEYDDAYAQLRALTESLGMDWLDREVITVGDVRLLGTTLWSDFDALAQKEEGLTAQLKKRDKAFRAANFYLQKNTTLRSGQPMLAEQMRELALECQDWLRAALEQPFDGCTVVVTHFAPSLRSADPRYGLTPGTAGFCNGLDDLLPKAQLWMHGHLHCPHDYIVRSSEAANPAACRVVANPRGYRSKNEQEGFVEQLVIDTDYLF